MKTKKLLSLLALLCLTVTSAWAQTWTNIIVNSDMEGTDVSCFYVHEQAGGMYLARIIDGIGVDGSRAIKLQSSDNEANSWDTQFNMRLPYVLPAGTQYKLSFDYKSDKKAVKEGDENGTFGFQVSNEPGQYVWWTLDGWPEPCLSVSESDVNKWLHFEETYTVPADCDGVSKTDGGWLMQFRTIYINLAGNKVATKFIIDNVKVEIPSDVLSTLTPEPVTDPGLMILAPPYNVTLAEGTEDAAKWTITPAEATTTGVDKDETVTLNYTGKKKIKAITLTKKEAAAPAEETYKIDGVTGQTAFTISEAATLPFTKKVIELNADFATIAEQLSIDNITVSGNVEMGTLAGWDTEITFTGEGTGQITLSLNYYGLPQNPITISITVTKN